MPVLNPTYDPAPKPRRRAEEAPVPGSMTPSWMAPDPSLAVRLAEQAAAQARRVNEVFAGVNDTALYHVPDTLVWTGVQQNSVVLTAAVNDATTFFARTYGNENLAAFWSAELLTDPVQQERTMATLAYLRDLAPTTYAGIETFRATASRERGMELLQQVLRNGGSTTGLTAQERGEVGAFAHVLYAQLQSLPDTGTSLAFKTAVAVGATGDVTLSLSADEVAALEKYVQAEFGELGGLRQTGETPTLASVGIEQVRQLDAGVIVLDRDYAKANPAEAYAVETWLHQNHPELEIQYDRQGVVGSLLDKLGMGVDYLTAPVGAGIMQISELGEQLTNSPEDRARMLAWADDAEQRLMRGQVPDADVERTLRGIAMMRDIGTTEVGWSQFQQDVFRNANARVAGFGFADSYMRAANMLPGDPGYGPIYAVVGLLSNILMDPYAIGLAALSGARAARLIPRLAGATDIPSAVRGVTRSIAYRALAKTPEELMVTRPYMQAADRLWGLRAELGQDRFASATAIFFGDEAGVGGGTDVARYLSQATSREDMALSLMRVQFGSDALQPAGLTERMNAVTRALDREAELPGLIGGAREEARAASMQLELDALRARRAELITERAWLDSTISGPEWTKPMRQVFSSAQLRKLERLTDTPLSPEVSLIEGATRSTELLPPEVLRGGADAISDAMRADPGVEATTRTLFQRWKDLWTKPGYGELLTFPSTSVGAAAIRTGAKRGELLADHVEQSFRNITAMGRHLGLSEGRMTELMAPWAAGELTTSYKSYQWWTKTWETMIDESPKLATAGKAELRKMWSSFVNDRAPGYIEFRGPSGFGQWESTLYQTERNPITGLLENRPRPAFEADMFQTWRAPSYQNMREYISHTTRTMNEWRQSGGWGKRAISLTHLGLAQTWGGINALWRTTTLGFRLLGALPGRILAEEMVRMGAMGYASAVWHPVEWFMSTGLGTRIFKGTDFALMGESPTHALGVVVDTVESNPSLRLARMGREDISIADGTAFYRSYSDVLSRRYASRSTHLWLLPNMDHPSNALRAMEQSEDATQWLAHYADTAQEPLEAITRTQQELSQLVGTGPGAERVRAALWRGEAEFDGEVLALGTNDFALRLEEMANSGDWVPGISRLPRSAGDYLPGARIPALKEFRDRMFQTFYTKPDIAMARSPLWRQMAAREYRDLLRRGYTKPKALEVARAYAARGTADMLFSIGAKTPGEYWLRNINPFFPAWRELADTWILRIPQRLGAGSRALGAGLLARRTDVWFSFFENMGIVRHDAQGKPYVAIPLIGPLVNILTGAEVPIDVGAPLDTFAGVLPVPTGLFEKDEDGRPLPWHQRLKGLLPTLGGPATFGLGILNDITHGSLDEAEDWLTLYGTDASLGPMSVDRMLEAFGFVAPWMTAGTADYHESVRTWAMIDGMRIAWSEMGDPPRREDFDEERAFGQAYKDWAEELLSRGERYASRTYLVRAFSGMFLPFSIQVASQEKQQMGALWGFLNTLPNGDPLRSALIDSVIAQYPQLEPYMTGKTQDIRPGIVKPDESLDEFMQAVKDGEIEVRSATDWAVFAYGMNSYSIFQSRLDAIFESSGQTSAEWLVNFSGKEQVAQEKLKWQEFLDASNVRENFLPGQSQSFEDMFENYMQWKAIHAGEQDDLSLEQQRLLKFDAMMREYADYFTPNQASSDDYFKMRDEAYAALGPPKGDLSRGVSWWFTQVSDPYYTKLDDLYKQVNAAEPRNRAPIYAEINTLANGYYRGWTNPEHPEWGEFPSPEEYSFLKLDPEAQQDQIAGWANLPATFLSQFQREQVGYDIPKDKQDAASSLSSLVERANRKFDKYVVQHGLSFSSTAVKDARAKLDAAFGGIAEERGLAAYWEQANAPEYRRVDMALGLSERSGTWKHVAGLADSLRRYIESQDYSPGGSSALAQQAQTWFVNMVTRVRSNDAEFDAILTQLSGALGEEGKPLPPQELVMTLFFDVWSTSNAYYLDRR